MLLKLNRLTNLTCRNVENISHKLRVAFDLDGLRYSLSTDIAALQNGMSEFNTGMDYDVRRYRWPRCPFNCLSLRIKNYIIPKRLHDHGRHFVVLGPQV